MGDDARIRRKKRISNKTKSKSNNRTPSEILKIKSKNRADVLIDMMDDFKKFDTPRVNSCCTISGGRKKRGGHSLKLHELKLNEVYIKILLNQEGRRKKNTRRKRRKKRDDGKAIERQATIDDPLTIGHVYLFTPEHANNNSLPIEGALTNLNTGIEGVYQFLVGYRILNNKPNTDIIAVNRTRNLGLGRRKKKTRRKRRKKRDEAGCIPWRRRKKKKTKKSKPSIEEIIFELEKSNNPIDKKIAKELNLTLHGWR